MSLCSLALRLKSPSAADQKHGEHSEGNKGSHRTMKQQRWCSLFVLFGARCARQEIFSSKKIQKI